MAKAKGRLKGKQPKLSAKQDAHVATLLAEGEPSAGEIADLFGIGRSSVYRAAERHAARQSVVAV